MKIYLKTQFNSYYYVVVFSVHVQTQLGKLKSATRGNIFISISDFTISRSIQPMYDITH